MNGFLLSRDADIDLQDIFIYTDEFWGERQAKHYVAGLYEIFGQLGSNPGMGRLRHELGEGICSFPHGSHVISSCRGRAKLQL